MNKRLILILDSGAEQAVQCARRVRALGAYCEVLPASSDSKHADGFAPAGIILLEGSSSPVAPGVPVYNYDPSPDGEATLKAFLSAIPGCLGEWSMAGYAEEYIASIREKVGKKRVLLALSGGVDSSVCAALLSKAIGKQLTCLFVDTGLMRKGEPDAVERIFTEGFDVSFRRVNAESRFLSNLKGITDPEQKRKIVGEEFIRVFEDEAGALGAMDFLAQGTIYPDVIESGVGGKSVVKSHHNVGGMPENIGFEGILEPLRSLFKEEVRALGRELGLPPYLSERQPFPGPGLSVRVIGEVTKDKLDILREADAIFTSEIEAAGSLATQYFAVLTSLRSVGVSGQERTYGYTAALRAVSTGDFMEADWVDLPYPLLRRVCARIVAEVPQINRVVYDITPKPPGTIEWE